MSAKTVQIGIVGGGLMGRELATAIGRWSALMDHPVRPQLTALCDTNPEARRWFERIDTVRLTTDDYSQLLADDDIDVLYIAVPHHLHEKLYLDTIRAGKDFLGEKPFGIDLPAARRIVAAVEDEPALFVRSSSEIPFYPGAQLATEILASGETGQMIEARSSFLHSSDLNRGKPINWKRQARFCGQIGVMGDLGMHTLHAPLRLGWLPARVYAVLQNLVTQRPDGTGALVECDTVDNATLLCDVDSTDGAFPLTLETKRIAPGEMNTWALRAVGMDGGVEFSTRYPKTVRRFTQRDGRQIWEEIEVGSQSTFPTVTGGIFEFGFSDAILQMWASFLAEREGALGDRYGCVTPRQALASHEVFAAALRSAASGRAEAVTSA
jgi:predicted dehydrogenase